MAMTGTELAKWRTRIDEAKRLQAGQHRRWMESHYFVEGTWYLKQGFWIDPDQTPVNYATAYVKTIVAAIYARNPHIFIKARTRKYADFARAMETIVNYLWVELNLKQQIKRAIVDAVITGIGWVEVGYTASIAERDPQQQASNGLLSRLLGDAKPPEQQGVLDEYIKEFSAYAQRLSPWMVKLAPGYHDIHQMPYLIISEDIAPDDLKQHPYYAEQFDLDQIKATRNVKVDSQLISSPSRPSPTTMKGGLNMVRLEHLWDRRGQQRFTMVEGSDQATTSIDWPYCFEGFSQVPLIFNDIPETKDEANGYPLSDIYPMIPQLKELSLLRTAMVRHRKRSGTLILTRKGAATEEQRSKLQTGDDVTILEVDDPSGIIAHSPPAIPPDIYRINDRILADLDLVGGLSQVMVGAATGQNKTATEVSITAQGTSLRTSEKVDVIEQFSVEIARRLAAVVWEFYPTETIREMLGETAVVESFWPTLPTDRAERRRIIQQELAYSVEAGSTQPIKDKTIEREQKLRLVNILGAFAPELLRKGEVVRQIVEEFDDLDAEKMVVGSDATEQQTAMQEEQLLAQELPQVVGIDENHDAHLQVHAQAAQQAPPTAARDQHILAHQQAKLSKMPPGRSGASPGDAAGTAVNPEQLRQGSPDFADMVGSAGAMAKESGQNRGGNPNL